MKIGETQPGSQGELREKPRSPLTSTLATKTKMSTKDISDIIHFIGIEESNLLGNIANLGEDYFLIHDLDVLFQSCIRLKPGDKNLKIPLFLYLIAHGEFYKAISSFLRIHKSISFRCMRSALDCTFTFYYLLKNPDKIDIYLSKLSGNEDKEMEKNWNKTFLNIKKTIKNDIENFPLAKGLPELHEFCSIYSHSDALGILHRYYEDKESSMLQVKYFDYEKSFNDSQRWLGRILVAFFNIFLIYWREVFMQRAELKLPAIEGKITEFQKRLKTYTEKHPFETSEEDKVSE